MSKAKGLVFVFLLAALTFNVSNGARAQGNSWYASILGGANFISGGDVEGTAIVPGAVGPFSIDVDPGFVVGGAMGYTFPFGLSVEGELAFRRNGVDTLFDPKNNIGLGAPLVVVDGSIYTFSVMANAIYGFDLGNKFLGGKVTPFLGFGIGLALVTADVSATAIGISGSVTDDSDLAFAYQLIVGASYALTPKISVAAEYRLFGLTGTSFDGNVGVIGPGSRFDVDGFLNHAILVRFTWRFAWTGS